MLRDLVKVGLVACSLYCPVFLSMVLPSASQQTVAQPIVQPASSIPTPSGVVGWTRSKPFLYWTTGTRYTGDVDCVLCCDVRWPARVGRHDIAYTNLWLMLPSGTVKTVTGNWLVPERLRYDTCIGDAIAANAKATSGGYFGRLWVDPRKPVAQRWIRSAAERFVTAGYPLVFFDNANMANADTYQTLDRTQPLTDGDVWDMMASAVTTFQDEVARMGASATYVANVAAPWRHPDCVGYWWNLGVRGVMLETPDAKAQTDPAYVGFKKFGQDWIAKGGTLYVLLASGATGTDLATVLDSETTYVFAYK